MEKSRIEKQPRVSIESVISLGDDMEYRSDHLGDAERLARKYGYTVKIQKATRIGFIHGTNVSLAPLKGVHPKERLDFSKTVKFPSVFQIDKALAELHDYLTREDQRRQRRRQEKEREERNKALRQRGTFSRMKKR